MLKLKEIILQLDNAIYTSIEQDLVKSKAKSSLYLLEGLRKEQKSEKEICSDLELTNNAFYALKSRLQDKIQEYLPKLVTYNKEELITALGKIPEICSSNPRETANVILQKLEVDLIEQGMHNELLPVYSALKKVNLHSSKYYNYSQQYNKQLALMVSNEKMEEISGEFSKLMGQYVLSKNSNIAQSLQFLISKIDNVYELNQSRLIKLTKTLLHIQYNLFCITEEEFDILNKLELCDEIIDELNNDSWVGSYRIFVDFLYFEFFVSLKKFKLAEPYFHKVYNNVETLLLNSFAGCAISFLTTGFYFSYAFQKKELISKPSNTFLVDKTDTNAVISIAHYQTLLDLRNGDLKKARQGLQKTINDFSLVNLWKTEIELKILLSFILILEEEFEMADDNLKKILRKLKSNEPPSFMHIEYLIKFFDYQINKESNEKNSQKKKEAFMLFQGNNTGTNELLRAFIPVLTECLKL